MILSDSHLESPSDADHHLGTALRKALIPPMDLVRKHHNAPARSFGEYQGQRATANLTHWTSMRLIDSARQL